MCERASSRHTFFLIKQQHHIYAIISFLFFGNSLKIINFKCLLFKCPADKFSFSRKSRLNKLIFFLSRWRIFFFYPISRIFLSLFLAFSLQTLPSSNFIAMKMKIYVTSLIIISQLQIFPFLASFFFVCDYVLV